MPRILLLVSLAYAALCAEETLTFDALQEAVKRSHPAFLKRQNSVELKRAHGESELSYPSPKLVGTIAQADPAVGASELEYSVGLSQTIIWPGSRSHQSQSNALALESQRFQSGNEQLFILLAAAKDYHFFCIQQEIVELHRGLIDDEEKMLTAMKKAYEIGGVPRLLVETTEVDLMREKSHFRHLSHQLGRYAIALSHYWLQSPEPLAPECSDVITVNTAAIEEILSGDPKNSELAASRLTTQSAAEELRASTSYLRNLDATLFYDSEIDLERVGLALSIPLSFTGETQKKKEFARQKLLLMQAEEQETSLRVNAALTRLQEQVGDIRSAYNDYAANVVPASETLMQRYLRGVQLGKLGTTDLIVAKRSYIETIDEMYAIKREFYERLFELMQLKNIMPGDIR